MNGDGTVGKVIPVLRLQNLVRGSIDLGLSNLAGSIVERITFKDDAGFFSLKGNGERD